MFTTQPIGYARSPYKDTQAVPKGLGAKHEAEGVLEIQEEFAPVVGGLETRRADPNWNRPEPPSGCPAA